MTDEEELDAVLSWDEAYIKRALSSRKSKRIQSLATLAKHFAGEVRKQHARGAHARAIIAMGELESLTCELMLHVEAPALDGSALYPRYLGKLLQGSAARSAGAVAHAKEQNEMRLKRARKVQKLINKLPESLRRSTNGALTHLREKGELKDALSPEPVPSNRRLAADLALLKNFEASQARRKAAS